MREFIIVVSILLFAVSAFGRTIRVPGEEPTIQAGIDAAVDGNFHLQDGSPCVDAGDPSIEDRLSDWHPKWPDRYPNGARSDMGAYGGPGNIDWLK